MQVCVNVRGCRVCVCAADELGGAVWSYVDRLISTGNYSRLCPEVDIPHADWRAVPTQVDVSIATGGIDLSVILTIGL